MTDKQLDPTENDFIHWPALAFIATLCAVHTLIAWIIFPVYDDGTVFQWMADYNGDIRPHAQDVPIAAFLLQLFSDSGYFWELTTAMHWAIWAAMGLMTMQLWTLLFPKHRRYALPAACLALAPMLCETQHILVIIGTTSQIGPVLVYGAMLLLLRDAGRPAQRSQDAKKYLRNSIAIALLALGVLFSQYGLLAVFACTVLLAMLWIQNGDRPRVPGRMIGVFWGSGMLAYVLFTLIGGGRHSTRAESLLSVGNPLWWLLTTSGRLVSAVWQAAFGELLETIGTLQAGSKEFAASLAIGLVTAILVALASRYKVDRASDSDATIHSWFVTMGLLVSIALTVIPIVVMGRKFIGTVQTRFWIPLLPVASCTSLYFLLVVMRRRLAWMAPPICGLLVGYCTIAIGLHSIAERQLVAGWGKTLRPFVVDDGLTVAIFEIPPRRLIPFNNGWIAPFTNNEFTARLAMEWPSPVRKRFWAFSSWETASRSLQGVTLDRSTVKPYLRRYNRGSVRDGPVKRILWVHVDLNDASPKITVQDVAPFRPTLPDEMESSP